MTAPNEAAKQAAIRALANSVQLGVPARPEMWGLVRIAVSTAAASFGVDLDRSTDLLFAADELCNLCAAGAGPFTTLQVVVRFDASQIAVSCGADELADVVGGDPGPFGVLERFGAPELSRRILGTLVDDFEISPVQEASRRGWFVLRG
ncbi:MAG: hypothetical protein ACRD0Z_00595 [Acidimicrobiales bacterium]